MKTETIKEPVAFTLQSRSNKGTEKLVKVSFADLRYKRLGTIWIATAPDDEKVETHEEIATLVYKSVEGAAVLFETMETPNDAQNPADLVSEKVLRWYEFA